MEWKLELLTKKKIFFISLDIGGFRGKKIFSLISYPFKFALSLFKVMRFIQKYKISRVLVFGGYISLPVGFAAKLMRKNYSFMNRIRSWEQVINY